MQFRVLLFISFFVLMGATTVAAQMNPPVITAHVVQGQAVTGVELYSMENIRSVDEFDHADENAPGGRTTKRIPGTNRFELKYTPVSGFVGIDRGVFECTESPVGPKTYITIEIHVGTSVVQAADDYSTVTTNAAGVTIDVLSNDVSSEGSLSLSHVEAVSGGSVSISGDQVIFAPAPDFSGIAQFAYVAKDAKGTTNAASAFINVVPATIESDLVSYTQVSSAPFSISMPGDGYVLADDQSPLFGTLQSQSSFTYQYTPTLYTEGFETLRFVHPTTAKERIVEIQLIKDVDVQNALVDDIAYVSKGGSVLINAEENDYIQGGVVIDHSSELSYASGAFYYAGDAQYEGIKELYYTIHDGQRAHTANIYVYVGDYLPQVTSYDFVTFKGTPLVLDYAVPIDNYAFTIVNAPANGTLQVNQATVANGDCGSAQGEKLIAYVPNAGYTGSDQFEIEYCVTGGACQKVQATINVVDSDADCHCAGADCVWAGDANGDGVVNMADLLAIGYHYGESGAARSDLHPWGANAADSWAADQRNGQNTNKVDANGDGTVSVADTAAIIANYGRQDNLIASNTIVDKTIPVSFSADNPTPKPGDVVTIEIKLGSETQPVVDLHGWTTSIVLPPTWTTDSTSSVTFTPNQQWFGKGSPVVSLVYAPTPGTIDIGITRTADAGISGFDIGGELRVSGAISLDPIRPDGDELPVELIFPASIMTDGSGQQYRVEGGKVTLMYQLGDTSDDNEKIVGDLIDVLAYPNPTAGAITLHANNRDIISSVAVYDMLGREVYRRSAISSNEHVIRGETLAEGLYFAHVTTQKGRIVKRIDVVR